MFNAKQQPTDNAIEKYYWCQMTSTKKTHSDENAVARNSTTSELCKKWQKKATRKKW